MIIKSRLNNFVLRKTAKPQIEMKQAILLLATLFFVCLEGYAQKFFVQASASQTLGARAQIDSLLAEFGENFDSQKYTLPISFAVSVGKTVQMTAITYRTQDPLGNEILASGLVAYPVKGALRGTVEVAPYSKEKGLCGSKRLYTLETLPSILGYVVLVPDTIGYGISEDEVIPLLLSRNTAQVSADMRQAVREYFRSVGEKRALPSETSLFGYSLGASGTLALACHYTAHPELGVKLEQIYMGGGAYDPGLSLRGTLQRGENGFLLFPAIAQSLNRWRGLGLNPAQLFTGEVLRDFDYIASCRENPADMAQRYGTDVHTYLHPDCFREGHNEDLLRLMKELDNLVVPGPGEDFPHTVPVYIRHSAQDTFVPVECSDRLVRKLKEVGHHSVLYRRDRSGTHYETAARSFLDLFLLLL